MAKFRIDDIARNVDSPGGWADETYQFMDDSEFDKEFDLEAMLDAWKIDPKTQELLERLGSDFDENGKPYWHDNV